MVNSEPSEMKIYGYDEELWYKVIKEGWKSGDRSASQIAALLQENNAGKRIIDLGCGVGRISNRLALRGYSVVGIDLSTRCIEEALRLAKQLGVEDRTRYIVGDYTRLEQFIDSKFDAATCIHAPSWKETPEITSFFNKLAGFTSPDSVLIIQDTLKETFLHALYSCPPIQSWYKMEGGILSLHSWRYDPETSILSSSKEFYKKTDEGFSFISKIDGRSTMRPLSEYVNAIRKAGWDVIRVEKPGAIDLLKMEEYNNPWWMNSATIVARRI